VHVDWQADVAPRLLISHYSPPFRPGSRESAVTQLLRELLTSPSAPLFQKLRYEKQTVTSFSVLGGSWGNQFLEAQDTHLIGLSSELVLERFRKDGEAYVKEVESDVLQGLEDLKRFSQQPDAAKTLDIVKSKFRYDFLNTLSSTGDIAEQFSVYYRFERDPGVFNTLMKAIDTLTPEDVDAYAARHFRPERRIVTTLWRDPAKSDAGSGKEGQ
jgi:predicted Zn-dependent peptidase